MEGWGAGRLGPGSGFSAIRLKHPIRYIQWISPFCLQTLSILAHKGVRLCAVQFGNYEGVQFPLIKTVSELNEKRTEKENVILKSPGCLAGEPRGGASVSSAAYDNIGKKTQNLTGKHTTTGQGNAKRRRLLMTPMIRACNGSQVCVECLDVRCLSFSRRRRFKKTYHCNSRTQLRCVIHPAETDFTSRFQSRSLTSSFLKIPHPTPF